MILQISCTIIACYGLWTVYKNLSVKACSRVVYESFCSYETFFFINFLFGIKTKSEILL